MRTAHSEAHTGCLAAASNSLATPRSGCGKISASISGEAPCKKRTANPRSAERGRAEGTKPPPHLEAKFLEDRVVVVDFERCAEVEEYIGTVCAGIRGKSSSPTTHGTRADVCGCLRTFAHLALNHGLARGADHDERKRYPRFCARNRLKFVFFLRQHAGKWKRATRARTHARCDGVRHGAAVAESCCVSPDS